MFFQQFDSKFRWIKRREGRGGSIAGGDINGPRNFSPKEKINTSYYAPFAFLLRVCSCESIEAWDVGKKVFFPVWFFFFLAFFFSLPLGRESGEWIVSTVFSRRCVIIARDNWETFSTRSREIAFDSAAKSSSDLFFSQCAVIFIENDTCRRCLLRRGACIICEDCPLSWIIARWLFFLSFSLEDQKSDSVEATRCFFYKRVSRRGNNVERGEDILQNGEISVELIREDRIEVLFLDRIFIILSNNLEIFST